MATNDKKLVTFDELYKYDNRVLFKYEFDSYIANNTFNSDIIIFTGEIKAKNNSDYYSSYVCFSINTTVSHTQITTIMYKHYSDEAPQKLTESDVMPLFGVFNIPNSGSITGYGYKQNDLTKIQFSNCELMGILSPVI